MSGVFCADNSEVNDLAFENGEVAALGEDTEGSAHGVTFRLHLLQVKGFGDSLAEIRKDYAGTA
jgi:hypothetical protein